MIGFFFHDYSLVVEILHPPYQAISVNSRYQTDQQFLDPRGQGDHTLVLWRQRARSNNVHPLCLVLGSPKSSHQRWFVGYQFSFRAVEYLNDYSTQTEKTMNLDPLHRSLDNYDIEITDP